MTILQRAQYGEDFRVRRETDLLLEIVEPGAPKMTIPPSVASVTVFPVTVDDLQA